MLTISSNVKNRYSNSNYGVKTEEIQNWNNNSSFAASVLLSCFYIKKIKQHLEGHVSTF